MSKGLGCVSVSACTGGKEWRIVRIQETLHLLSAGFVGARIAAQAPAELMLHMKSTRFEIFLVYLSMFSS